MFERVDSSLPGAGPRRLACIAIGPLLAALLGLAGCQDPGTEPVAPPPVPCEDPSRLNLPFRPFSYHRAPVRMKGTPAALPNTKWATGEAVRAFFGNKHVKVVFTLNLKMYLLEYAGGEAVVTTISSGDESLSGLEAGSINSPLFSPDGRKLVYAGTTRGKPAFIRDAVGGDLEAVRIPLDPKARVTADPHWVVEGGKTWIYFSTMTGLLGYKPSCDQFPGATYKAEVVGDSVGPAQITGIPGSYRGGLSKDGRWAGTSYSTSALYDRVNNATIVLAGGSQKCNASMNPFPPGSLRSDYMMILAFGGDDPYRSIEGDSVYEEQHQNLWIYNRDDKVVWQAKRPDTARYERWEKPEWSTHPEYATAVALFPGLKGDLYVIRIGDLANAEEGVLRQAQGYLKIAEGGFNSDSYSHLWVGE